MKSELQLRMEPQARALWQWAVNSFFIKYPELDKPVEMETQEYWQFYIKNMDETLKIYCDAVVDRNGPKEEDLLLINLGGQMHAKLIARAERELLFEVKDQEEHEMKRNASDN